MSRLGEIIEFLGERRIAQWLQSLGEGKWSFGEWGGSLSFWGGRGRLLAAICFLLYDYR